MYERDANKYLKNHKIYLTASMKSRALQKLNSNIISKAQYTRICNTIRHIERSELSKISVKKKDIEIQKYLNTLISDYSNSTISKKYGEFRQAFEYLYNSGFIKINPRSEKESIKRKAMNLEGEKFFMGRKGWK